MKGNESYYGLSTKPYKKCIVCGTINDGYRKYCFCCNRSLDISKIGLTTSTERIDMSGLYSK